MTDPKSLVNKVHVAISFGSPDDEVTREIMDELQALITRLDNAEKDRDTTALSLQVALNKLARIHELCGGKLGSVYDDDTQYVAQEVLGVIDDQAV